MRRTAGRGWAAPGARNAGGAATRARARAVREAIEAAEALARAGVGGPAGGFASGERRCWSSCRGSRGGWARSSGWHGDGKQGERGGAQEQRTRHDKSPKSANGPHYLLNTGFESLNLAPTAAPTFKATSAVIGNLLTVPRMPSVPKYLRVITGNFFGIFYLL